MSRQTSIETYNIIKANGLLSERRWEVYSFLFENGPLTQTELTNRFPKGMENSLRPRFAELEKMGVIKVVDVRQCKVTGRSVYEWEVTDKLPVKLTKLNKIECEHCHGNGYKIQE